MPVTVAPRVLAAFRGKARWRGVYGGRGSGKSRGFAAMLVLRVAELDAKGVTGTILCARQFQNSIDDSSFAEIRAALLDDPALAARFKIGENYIRTQSGRIKFVFRGLERNLGSLKSIFKILIAWVEEAEFVSEDAWRILIPTVREPGSEIWATWNPASQQSPVHRRLRANPPRSSRIVECNWRDNPWFPAPLFEEMREDWEKRPDDAAHIWEGDFRVAWEGAYWGREMREAGMSGRIGEYPIIPGLAVHAVADLGSRVNNPFWLFQVEGPGADVDAVRLAPRLRVVGFYEPEAATLESWRDGLMARGWTGNLYLPHDVMTEEWAAGRTRFEKVAKLGMRPKRVPMVSVQDGIEAGRTTIAQAVFDAQGCANGLDGLRSYRRRWNIALQQFEAEPLKDWAEHIGSAFRYASLSWRHAPEKVEALEPRDARGVSVSEFIEAKKRKLARKEA